MGKMRRNLGKRLRQNKRESSQTRDEREYRRNNDFAYVSVRASEFKDSHRKVSEDSHGQEPGEDPGRLPGDQNVEERERFPLGQQAEDVEEEFAGDVREDSEGDFAGEAGENDKESIDDQDEENFEEAPEDSEEEFAGGIIEDDEESSEDQDEEDFEEASEDSEEEFAGGIIEDDEDSSEDQDGEDFEEDPEDSEEDFEGDYEDEEPRSSAGSRARGSGGLEYLDLGTKAVPKRKRLGPAAIIGRILLVFFTVIFLAAFTLVALCHTLLTGPSETMRDRVVLSAMQASATKWLPGLFLEDSLVEEICARSADVQEETVSMGSFVSSPEWGDSQDPGTGEQEDVPQDEWADAIDGMIYKTYNGSTFKAYILLVKDPSRVYVGTSSDYQSGKIGIRIFDIVEREGAVAAINGGEFSDIGGHGTGDTPIGLTYSKGACVWDDGNRRTFIGFDRDNVLHAFESMTKEKAEELGIRDAVSFQTGNVLISNDQENVTLYYSEGNIGMAQRTAIGQRADGTVVLVVTDGRTASSLGATRNDVIDLLVSEGVVVAGMLDGGSSAMMYYRDYYTKYDIDVSGLDEYQKQGLTNRYKAFTRPRHMPTFFLVAPEE